VSTANDLFALPAGSLLQMQATVPENAPRYSVRMIGSLPGSSLIVTTPMVDGKVQIVREGQRFNIRVLKGERVLGFVAQVMHASLKPYPHLHLEYPTEFEQIVVRNASRVSTRVDCLVRNTAETGDEQVFRPAQFVDLSETGAKIASDSKLGEVGAVLHVKFQVEVSGVVEEMGLLAEVRNVAERTEAGLEGDKSVVYSGVQFRTLSRYQQILLHAWVTNQVLQSALRSQRS
jgi:hypothetical protein